MTRKLTPVCYENSSMESKHESWIFTSYSSILVTFPPIRNLGLTCCSASDQSSLQTTSNENEDIDSDHVIRKHDQGQANAEDAHTSFSDQSSSEASSKLSASTLLPPILRTWSPRPIPASAAALSAENKTAITSAMKLRATRFCCMTKNLDACYAMYSRYFSRMCVHTCTRTCAYALDLLIDLMMPSLPHKFVHAWVLPLEVLTALALED